MQPSFSWDLVVKSPERQKACLCTALSCQPVSCTLLLPVLLGLRVIVNGEVSELVQQGRGASNRRAPRQPPPQVGPRALGIGVSLCYRPRDSIEQWTSSEAFSLRLPQTILTLKMPVASPYIPIVGHRGDRLNLGVVLKQVAEFPIFSFLF